MRIFTLMALQLALSLSVSAPEILQAANPPSSRLYRQSILPILQSRCISCHGPETQEGDIRLDNISRDTFTSSEIVSTWQKAKEMLAGGAMPPEDADQLTVPERTILSRWIDSELKRVKSKLKGTTGRVVLRRLNRQEYQNTMRD
jgi:uncharacterized membrane protein